MCVAVNFVDAPLLLLTCSRLENKRSIDKQSQARSVSGGEGRDLHNT